MNKVTVRPYTIDDYDALLSIQKEAFPPPFPSDLWWLPEQIQSHVEIFPEGGLIVEVNGVPAGSATSLLVQFDGSNHTWEEVSDSGYIRRSHQPDGDSLYGIDLCVRPSMRGQGIAQALYEARKQTVRNLNLTRFIAACRIPGYHHHAEQQTVQDYVHAVQAGTLKDQVLCFMLKQGLTPLSILPNYVDDEESLNYAVLVEWLR
ncbi:GNAT family N-acetyltransferase [Alkalicoccobacillus murimartini]|uniref:GNAT superfamily N-acetyltransferase n=1 Tax=Alkalicoccobacillus murimartini TaxID=171685 RepID=A0ABT9YHZ0_9BACI|nr:GNAT family N-acetyltransferase [Alkalicoccobacillus murimartini]MDQ0207105.1 GNAT superfamily N-acetyltransferase [Alkalicoccobacillus murimartini]